MSTALHALALAAQDPSLLARFWSGLLGWDVVGTTLVPRDDTGFGLLLVPTDHLPATLNVGHLDLTSSSPADQQRTVDRALALGARHLDVGQGPDAEHVVLADPEGNAFCVLEAGNAFLADCGFVGALACDGSYDVGVFWSRALGWPLVWDQGQETAIRSPHGGPKLTWGGPPFATRDEHRLRFVLAPTGGTDQAAEVERLVALGATRLHDLDGGGVELADPDGTPFTLLRADEA